jgi:lipopolysaccharide transport system permease protein
LLSNLANLFRYRGLVQSLVARELKARYRGSALGFLWSFINPLLLLLIYSFVFTTVMPNETKGVQPYQLFMFCGILPWTWFSTSLSDAAGSLISGGNLIKKVLFPAEVLPLVSVLTNMVHFFLGLPILVAFLLIYRHYPNPANVLWFPVAVLVQLLFTSALALIVSALAVHFRDIRDILANLLTLWFFATPIPGSSPACSSSTCSSTSTRSRISRCRTRRSCFSTAVRWGTGSGCSRSAPARCCCSSPATGCSTGCATPSRRQCSHDDDSPRGREQFEGHEEDVALFPVFFVCLVFSW